MRKPMNGHRPLLTVLGCAALLALTVPAAPPAGAAAGLFVYDTPAGRQVIPFPDENKCYPTPGATAAMNYTRGDAYFYTDADCTIGKDAGNAGPFSDATVPFEGVKLRTGGG